MLGTHMRNAAQLQHTCMEMDGVYWTVCWTLIVLVTRRRRTTVTFSGSGPGLFFLGIAGPVDMRAVCLVRAMLQEVRNSKTRGLIKLAQFYNLKNSYKKWFFLSFFCVYHHLLMPGDGLHPFLLLLLHPPLRGVLWMPATTRPTGPFTMITEKTFPSVFGCMLASLSSDLSMWKPFIPRKVWPRNVQNVMVMPTFVGGLIARSIAFLKTNGVTSAWLILDVRRLSTSVQVFTENTKKINCLFFTGRQTLYPSEYLVVAVD